MSLQVWLPLTGNLNNQGLSNITPLLMGTGITYTAGKIGTSATFPNNCASCIHFPGLKKQIGSWCAWIKVNGEGSGTSQRILSEGRDSYTSGTEIYVNKAGTTIYGQSHKKNINTTINLNTWYHICLTFDSNNIQLFLNGELKASTTCTEDTLYDQGNEFTIGKMAYSYTNTSNYFPFNGQVNDVRIYDHCLSDKEVQEIAKGLVLHYKLDDPYVENSNIINSIINDTAYNSSLGKYGYNETSNLGKINGNFHGKDCVKIYTLTEGQTAQPYAYFSNLFTSNGTNASAYKALSFDYFTTVPTTTWLNIYKLGSGSGTAIWKTINSNGTFTGTYTNSSNSITVKPNEWNHIEIVFHGTTDANAEWGYCINGPAHTTNSQYYFLYANIQVEENDHVTGYGNNFHNNIVYDSSGYNNNGIPNSNLTIKNDTSQYSISSYFGEYNTPNIILQNTSLLPALTNCTICWWGKYDTTKTLLLTGQTTSIYLAASNNNTFYHASAGSPIMYKNGIQGTYSCLAGTWDFYVLKNVNLNSWTTLKINSYSSGWPLKGYLSDFRIYATELTDEQILDLYHTSASIDKTGKIYARELVEK